MKIGFLFPGQGSQSIGMGKDLYEKYEKVKNIYKKVEEITGVDIAKISFDGNQDELNETKNTQLAILTMSLAILKILEENEIRADISSGLSLGEYSALIYSGALDFETGVKIVQKRGEYMQNLVPNGNWLMAAIIGLEDSKVQEICQNVKGFAVPVNFNCPGQVVISGDEEGVNQAENIAKEMGAKKVMILKTTGPFHTNKLEKAADELKSELENIKTHSFKTSVVKNLDGKIYDKNDNIKEILTKHITNPVRFSKCLETMINTGVDTFIEIGPGRTLSGFLKRMPTDKKLNILNINNVETLEKTLKFIEEN